MPVPSVITDLSATAASNSPTGNENPIEGDNHLRTAYAFIRQLYDGATGAAYALTADLASTSDAAKGDALVGALDTSVSGAAATTWHAMLNLKVKGLKKTFGATGDGAANDRTAINNALTATGKIIEVEDGTFLYNSALSAPTCSAIIGWGDLVSILKPGVGVTKGLSVGGGANYPRELRGFQILGTAATTATGLYLGDAGSCAVFLYNVRCKGFSGAGGVGARIGDLLKSQLIGLTVEGNENGLLVQKTSAAFPTTVLIQSGVATGNSKKGVKVIDANMIILENFDFESNTEEGLYVDSSSGSTAVDLILKHCWFEANYGNTNTQYHARFGTNSGAGTIRPKIADTFFDTNSGGTKARSMIFNGSEVAGFTIEGYRPASEYANGIVIQNGAYGTIEDWPANVNYRTVVSDASGSDYGPFGPMRDYAPGNNFSSSVGNYGASFSGSATVNTYRYKVEGKTLRMEWDVVLQLLAVTPAWIKIPIPPGLTLKNNNVPTGALQLLDGATGKAAICALQTSDNTVLCRPADLSNLTSGAAITLRGSIVCELA